MSRPGPQSAQFNQDLGNWFFDVLESAIANPLNQLNRIGTGEAQPYDPNLKYEDVFQGAGLPPWAAAILGIGSRIIEPGPPVPRAARRASVMDPDTGRPLVTYRAEAPGGGRGPVAQGAGFEGNARYHGEPSYVRGWDYQGNIVREGSPMARPGGALDVRYAPRANLTPDEFSRLTPEQQRTFRETADLMDRVEASALATAPPEQVEFLQRMFGDYRAGARDANDIVNDLRHVFGHDLGPVPQRAGMDVLLQLADDGRNVGTEVVTFGRDNWRDLNVYGPGEFRKLLRGR